MKHINPTPGLIEQIVANIPEGFIREGTLGHRFYVHNKGRRILQQSVHTGKVGHKSDMYFDLARLTADQLKALSWCAPSLPALDEHGVVTEAPIVERRAVREQTLSETDPAALAVLNSLPDRGYIDYSEFTAQEGINSAALERLLERGNLLRRERFVYDPLELSEGTINMIVRRDALIPLHEQLLQMLSEEPGTAASHEQLLAQFGNNLKEIVALGGVTRFSVPNAKGEKQSWFRLDKGNAQEAEKAAERAIRQQETAAKKALNEAWDEFLPLTGDVLRPGARDGKSPRMRAIARTYTMPNAARRLSIHEAALNEAVRKGIVTPITDPEGKSRMPASIVEQAVSDPEFGEQITAFEEVAVRDLALVSGVHYSTARSRLLKEKLSTREPRWGQVRGKWGLPNTLAEFRPILKVKREEWREERHREYEAALEAEHQKEIAERQRRDELRQRLIAIFPNWRHENRMEQQVVLHVGPTNSGKTHTALNRLAKAGNGWYLAPLRMLAFEVFDRLNQRGVPCELLTGEEYIPVPGARITASTIEMFNASDSGECVVIDEAHMLADPDRGWAWTRAFMEAQSAEIHLIGAPTIRSLVRNMAEATYLPLVEIEYQRLTPLRVADEPWRLDHLPERTILVAFSRKLVLALKTQLEGMGRRVSVVYGSLPPEVRRRQAERFAAGETEICVATDAVGMGLNLPADNVCFYEVEKFDGRQRRRLAAIELQQIGGRAGRYGLSKEGLIGALTPEDLGVIRKLFDAHPHSPTRARIAPTVESLELIPGTLADQLLEWARLQSIPESMRDMLQTADLSERIELARLLSNKEIQQLGLETALRLINAPTRPETRAYWRDCATAILTDWGMPLPPEPPEQIRNTFELDQTETCILSADVYLWLSQRKEFWEFAPDEEQVRKTRWDWSMRVDDALVRQVDTARRCPQCGRRLPLNFRHRLCDSCFSRRRWGEYDDIDDVDEIDMEVE